MKQVKLWFVEDTDGGPHGYGKTRKEAEAFVSGNRAYDDYDGSRFRQCVADGWAKPAVEITVPEPVAATLLDTCKV